MHESYGDDYESIAGPPARGLIPDNVRRLAGAAVFLGLIAAMGFWAYRLGTRDATAVPVVQAMDGPARVQPEDPGGLEAAHQGLEVNSILAGEPAPIPRAAPAPQAAPPALAEEDAPIGELVIADPPAPLAADDAAGDVALRVPPQEEIPGATEIAAVPDFAAASAEATPDAPPDAMPDAPEAAAASPRPRGRPAGFVVARATPAPAATPAAATPAAATPAAATPAATAPAPAPAAGVQEVSQKLAAGTRLIQLGAYDSEAMTRDAWRQLVARYGDLLGSKRLYVERATSNARVFYRLRVAGFESAEQTRVMCEALRARSVDCIPVTLQ